MTEDTRFYSNLSYDTATHRLQHADVRGVTISVTQPTPEITQFRFDLQTQTPIGTWIMAHLKGTIQEARGNQLEVTYQTRAFSHRSLWLIVALGLSLSVILFLLLPSSMVAIISAPGIASIMLVLFWSVLGEDVRKNDQFRLQELVERMLEKHTTMMTWQA